MDQSEQASKQTNMCISDSFDPSEPEQESKKRPVYLRNALKCQGMENITNMTFIPNPPCSTLLQQPAAPLFPHGNATVKDESEVGNERETYST